MTDFDIEIKYEIVYNTTQQETYAVDPDKDTSNKIFYSVDRLIYSWNKLDGNVQLIVETDAVIRSLHHIGPEKLIIRGNENSKYYVVEKTEQKTPNSSACILQVPNPSNYICRLINNSQNWGPIAIDYSKPEEVYFAASSTLGKLNLKDDMDVKTVWQSSSIKGISTMTFNKEFTKLYFVYKDKPASVSHLDLSTFVYTQVPMHNHIQIEQAVIVGKNGLLCLTTASELILLDTNSGHYSQLLASDGHKTALPCNHSDCSEGMEIKALASDATQDGHLYALDIHSRILALDYRHIGKKKVSAQRLFHHNFIVLYMLYGKSHKSWIHFNCLWAPISPKLYEAGRIQFYFPSIIICGNICYKLVTNLLVIYTHVHKHINSSISCQF